MLTLILLALIGSVAVSAEEPMMNGYSLAQFGDFTRTWHLVTTRYRKDTGELRFTYANDLAWQTISENRTDYPDGAIFGKVGIVTKPDPDFESSAVPAGARRVQFMVRKSKEHAATEGWGYAIFDSQGQLMPGDLKGQTEACAACHRLVPQRGFVFSQPMALHALLESQAPQLNSMKSAVRFESRLVSSLPSNLAKRVRRLSPGAKEVRSLVGPLTRNVFFGTLDEIRPSLAQETLRSRKPSLLLSDKGEAFSLVVLKPSSRTCGAGSVAMHGIHATSHTKTAPYEISFCQTQIDRQSEKH